MVTKISKKDIIRVHALLAQIGMANDKEYKKQLVQQYTGGRETSTTGLLVNEAGALINDLQAITKLTPEQQQEDRKRKLIIHYAREMMWEKVICKCGHAPMCGCPIVADMERINGWCVEYGYLHKPLNDYTLAELSKLVWQMQQVHSDLLKSI